MERENILSLFRQAANFHSLRKCHIAVSLKNRLSKNLTDLSNGRKLFSAIRETIQNTASEAGYYCLVNWTQRYRVEYQDYKQETKSRELIVRDGELCDFKDGEANSLRIWLEMKESGENLLGYMVKSGIEGLEKKNGIGENGISQATL